MVLTTLEMMCLSSSWIRENLVSAILSDCRKYRYKLYREVDRFGDKVFAYFGINPSTADETADDATVRKWKGFTERNGGERFIVANVFAYRSTNVNELASINDPQGPENKRYVMEVIKEANVLIPCWGSRFKLPKNLHDEIDDFLQLLIDSGKPVLCFGKTASGDPKHPLMLGYDTKLIEF